MDCRLEQCGKRWVCSDCGFSHDKPIRKQCGNKSESPKPACPDCGTTLVKKKRLPEGKWFLRCEVCHKDIAECRGCNAKHSNDQR